MGPHHPNLRHRLQKLQIYIPLDVHATNIDTPHFIRTISSILPLISPRSHPATRWLRTHTNSRAAIPYRQWQSARRLHIPTTWFFLILNEDGSPSSPNQGDEDKDECSTLRLSALEFMISLSEACPNIVRKVPGWMEIIVRAYLEGMGEFDEEETSDLEGWLKEDVGYFHDFFIFVLGVQRVRSLALGSFKFFWIGLCALVVWVISRSPRICNGRTGNSTPCIPGTIFMCMAFIPILHNTNVRTFKSTSPRWWQAMTREYATQDLWRLPRSEKTPERFVIVSLFLSLMGTAPVDLYLRRRFCFEEEMKIGSWWWRGTGAEARWIGTDEFCVLCGCFFI